jgi:Tfp pilus assembly PilM family ATPase
LARFLALDWDQNHLYVVSASIRGGAVKIERAAAWQEERSPNPADAAALGKVLRERLKSAGIAAAPVLACLGRDRVILKDVRYPSVPPAEEPGLVRFQAAKDLTDAADEVVIDYTAIGAAAANGEQKALVLIARKELVGTWQTLCQAAGLKLVGLTARPLGLAACARKALADAPPEVGVQTAEEPAPAPGESAHAVVAVAERWAEFAILRGPDLVLARSLNVGPMLAAEVRRNLTVYAGQNPRCPVRSVFLAGKDAAELRQRLEEAGVAVRPFDPFGGVDNPNLPTGPARGAFAGAAGLLYARAAGPLPINFVQPRQPVVQRDPKRVRLALAGCLFLAVFAAAGVYANAEKTRVNNETLIAQAEAAEAKKQRAAEKDRLLHLKGLEDWDGPRISDEIYDLTDRIPDVNLLRVNEIRVEPIARTSKSREVIARITIKGVLLGGASNRRALDQLVDQFHKDHAYTLESPPRLDEGSRFTLVVRMDRRAPADYEREIKARKANPPRPLPPRQDGE